LVLPQRKHTEKQWWVASTMTNLSLIYLLFHSYHLFLKKSTAEEGVEELRGELLSLRRN